ncbi:uncharacterized protein LOC115218462 [Octopus sinensis]|uniref:Uncharacterized protein LOC115218462 n=1 Tax=Octopus sinensis TaxID=2607531 RepID=A0A6P7T0D2_9MOLL|nr:uncharacterized protein LOC115218462 [Octopus sinensis]
MDFYTFFGPLFLLIVLVNKSSAIRCYSCSSFENPNCGDAFDFKYVKAYACTGSCKKTRGLSKNNDAEVNRMCSSLEKDSCYSSTYNDIDVTACVCNTDYCNSAPLKHVSSITLNFCLATLTYLLLIHP